MDFESLQSELDGAIKRLKRADDRVDIDREKAICTVINTKLKVYDSHRGDAHVERMEQILAEMRDHREYIEKHQMMQ